jgi:RNA polymerase sigma-70 factor (ECF subfamily)
MATPGAAAENIKDISDIELIAFAISGREDGFEGLVRRYQRPITGYIFRMLGDYEASLDVSQEVFIKVYNTLSR